MLLLLIEYAVLLGMGAFNGFQDVAFLLFSSIFYNTFLKNCGIC